jgi:hypothetical protein
MLMLFMQLLLDTFSIADSEQQPRTSVTLPIKPLHRHQDEPRKRLVLFFAKRNCNTKHVEIFEPTEKIATQQPRATSTGEKI